jgi:hypothetical protein
MSTTRVTGYRKLSEFGSGCPQILAGSVRSIAAEPEDSYGKGEVCGKVRTEASKRPIPIDPFIAEDLVLWCRTTKYNRPADYVFATDAARAGNERGKQPVWLSKVMSYRIQPVAKRLGIAKLIGWHTFRRTYTTLLHANGEDVKVVQELLRHGSARITMDVYAQAMTPAKRRAQGKVVAIQALSFSSYCAPLCAPSNSFQQSPFLVHGTQNFKIECPFFAPRRQDISAANESCSHAMFSSDVCPYSGRISWSMYESQRSPKQSLFSISAKRTSCSRRTTATDCNYRFCQQIAQIGRLLGWQSLSSYPRSTPIACDLLCCRVLLPSWL